MQQMDTDTLFTKVLYVINEALSKNKDTFPYREIIAAGEKLLGDRNIGVAVYADDPVTPYDYFTIRFHKGKFELVAHGKAEPEFAWKVSRDYLQQVVDNSLDYINHPEKLDWDWLRNRLGF